MSWQQIAMIVMFSCSFILAIISHGLPRTGRYNFWSGFAGIAIEVAILWTAGFWNVK